jgi:ATP-binding cassette subfamily B protein
LNYLFGLFWIIFTDIIQLFVPRIIGNMVDNLKEKTLNVAELRDQIFFIVFLAILMFTSRFLWRIFLIGSSMKVDYYVRETLFEKFLKLPIKFYDRNKTGDLMARATNDITAVRMMFGRAIIMAVDATVLTIAGISIMVKTIDLRLTIISCIPFPVIAILSVFFGKMIHSRFMAVQEGFSKLSDTTQETFSGIQVVKSYVQEKGEIEKFRNLSEDYVEKNVNLVKLWGTFFPMITALSGVSLAISLWYGGAMVIKNQISLGDLIAQTSYVGMLVWPMVSIGWVVNIIERGLASLKRINQILEEDEISDVSIAPKTASLKGNIRINNLSFIYPGTEVKALENISLNVSQGQTIGIIGRTGSGKSTIARLLTKLYEVPDGKIFFDDYDINEIPYEILRRDIAVVPQETFLFSTTVKENIAFGKPDASMEEIIEAAKLAEIHDTIMSFPQKYETVVGERGLSLSGGQRQRVTLARALLMNPKILILDDALSAVDANTEREILANLKNYMKQRTSIIISHRIIAVKDADHIVVLDNGKIIEQGKHEELLRKEGVYYKIYKRQTLEEKILSEDN